MIDESYCLLETIQLSAAADPHGGRGGRSPLLDWGQKNFIARPKNTHICKPPFACQNVLKLTYRNLEFQNFPRRTPGPPLQGDGREREWREEKGRVGGRGRIGKGGEGRDRAGKEGRNGGGREGRGARYGLRPP